MEGAECVMCTKMLCALGVPVFFIDIDKDDIERWHQIIMTNHMRTCTRTRSLRLETL